MVCFDGVGRQSQELWYLINNLGERAVPEHISSADSIASLQVAFFTGVDEGCRGFTVVHTGVVAEL